LTVVDASVFVNAQAGDGRAGEAARGALRQLPMLQVPAVFPAEVTSAVRKMVVAGVLAEARARATLTALVDVAKTCHAFDPFVARVWELRHHLTVYDAWYVALAESLDATLLTADVQLAAAPGLHCPIEVVDPPGASA
jgi:predicted nucleic acid-binding protein